MSATGNAAVVLLALLAVGQVRPPKLDDIPPVDRVKENFYGALDVSGKGVTAEWSAPKAVPRDAEFTLTLVVRGAANPHELVRPDLRKFDDFKLRFQFLDKPDHTEPAADPAAKEVRFHYRLVVRGGEEVEVPRLVYLYYRPKAAEKERFQTARASSLRIKVTEPPKSVATGPTPIEAPEEFFTLVEDEPSPWSPGLFAWLLPVSAVPVLVGCWLLLWRLFFPDAARLVKLRRNRATRTALDRLKKARTSSDPAGVAAFAFRQYLTARFGVPPSAQTPAEVAAGLRDAEQPADRAEDAEAFLRACDAVRFDQPSDAGLSLVAQAESLVTVWEGGAT
jgi:hypothetical protein